MVSVLAQILEQPCVMPAETLVQLLLVWFARRNGKLIELMADAPQGLGHRGGERVQGVPSASKDVFMVEHCWFGWVGLQNVANFWRMKILENFSGFYGLKSGATKKTFFFYFWFTE